MRWLAVATLLMFVSTSAIAQPDWGAKRDPFDAGTVNRYKAILAKNPHDDGALRALTTLYKSHRTIAKLEEEYRAKLAGGDDWATLVVLAKLPRAKKADTLALWKRALVANPNDGRGWLASGDASTSDAAAARDAYSRAVQLAANPKDKRTALQKLVGAARSAGDAKLVDDTYAQLIELSPKDGMLWMDRGSAQVTAKQYTAAIGSFAKAESLLTTDPERRLTAMVNQGVAMETAGRSDDAVAQYIRTLDKTPAGHFMTQEIVARVVETERKRKRLGAAIEWIEKRWSEKKRGYFEWSLLGDLYKETNDEPRAIEAYKRAVQKAPTEVATQRKLIVLLDKADPDAARTQHEAAARIAPGDADIQIELAKRYYPKEMPKAYATLEALSRRMANNVSVRAQIAELYEKWDDVERVIREYEGIVKIEPKDPDFALALGDAYWRANKEVKALEAWKRLEAIGTATAHYRHGEILAMHQFWQEAVWAYTKSIELDGTSANTHYGRARALESLKRYDEALVDARAAVALTGNATHSDGLRDRALLVRLVDLTQDATPAQKWRYAFERGDIHAGYLLATHLGRTRTEAHHDVLIDLYRRVPTDDSLGIAVARSYSSRKQYARAKEELAKIAKRTPAREKDIAKLIEQVDEDRESDRREKARIEAALREDDPKLVLRDARWGSRFFVGTDVRNTSSAIIGWGAYRSFRWKSRIAIVTRFDWMQRDDDLHHHRAVALAVGFGTRLLDAIPFELGIAAAPRVELRYGDAIPSDTWERAIVGGDLTLEILPRKLPATLGVRFHQSLTDSARSSSLLVELGLEIR